MPQCKRRGRGSKPGNVKRQSHRKANAVPRIIAEEKRLAREMHFDQGMSRIDVAEALNRNLGWVRQANIQAPSRRAGWVGGWGSREHGGAGGRGGAVWGLQGGRG